MKVIIVLLLLSGTLALDCVLYDYSQDRVSCVSSCPSGSIQLGNYCLANNQYLSNSQVFQCDGPVSSDRSTCCREGQFVQGNSCLPCRGKVYSNGMACCPNDHYLDFTQTTPSCIKLQVGNCPAIALSSPFKVCCPQQQLYNVAASTCSATLGLNCDSSLLVCCPNGQFLEYSQQKYLCVSACSWRNGPGLLCQQKRCNNQLTAITSTHVASPRMMSALLAFSGRCCFGLDSSGNCISDGDRCLNSFANRGWSICCPNGQFFTISSASCAQECPSGYILLDFFCVAQGRGLDLRSPLGNPSEMALNGDCNGAALPPQLPFCCPAGFYIKDNTGCTLCSGNIILNIDTQVCCPFGYFFNATSSQCAICEGHMDSSMQLCCPPGTYVRYDVGGRAQCVSSCPPGNVYMGRSCCDSLSGGCSNTYSATTCNLAYFVPNSCKACPSFCSSDSNTCTAALSPAACSVPCRQSEIAVGGVGCLKCDPSCVGCTSPMNSSACSACAEGYVMLQRVCQACSVSCRTCATATDVCTSCFRQVNQTLFNGRCYGRCQNSGYFLDPASLTCQRCSPSCLQCTGSSSNCTMCPPSSFLSVAACQACHPSCRTCYSSANTCTTCSNNFFMTLAGTCVMQCQEVAYSAFVENGWCIQCHPECLGCVSHPQNCIACPTNTTFLDGSLGINICTACLSPCVTCVSARECTSCIEGFYLSGALCSRCDSSCRTCSGPSGGNCLSCIGTSTLSNGFCSGCSSTCAECSGTRCISCTSGYFIFNGNCLSACPPGTFPNGATCAPCDSSCSRCNATACLNCSDGFLYILKEKCFRNCPNGFVASAGFCMQTTNNTNNSGNNGNNNNNNNTTNNTTDNNTTNNNTNSNNRTNRTTLTQVGSIVDQTILVQGKTAYINLYFNSTDILSNNITVNLINKNNGNAIPLTPSTQGVSENRLSFSVALPSGSDLSEYSLIQTSATSPNGTTSTLLSAQSSSQLLLNDLQANAFSNMKVLSYIFSAIVLIYALLTKTKGHFTAQQANNIILHSLNFAQVCYLFKFATTMSEGGYFFLNGFAISHLTFFPNFFPPPNYYVEIPVEKSLVPDGNLLRNAGSSLSFQIIVISATILAVCISLGVQKARQLAQPPHIRKIMRLGALLLGIGYVNQLFFSFVQLVQPAAVAADYSSFHSSSAALSIALTIIVPLFMAGTTFHFYLTYNSDVLEHYYTLREASHFILAYAQAVVMAMGVGKPLVGLFLIGLQWLWFLFNFLLYRYGSGVQLSGYKKYWGISGAVSVGYLFLSVEWGVGWVAMVVMVSISMVVLLVYCTYQIVGIYYYNIFPKDQERHTQ